MHKLDDGRALAQHKFKYYDLVMVATCVIIVCSNIIGAGKVATIAGFSFGAGILFFPLSYVLGDVLTEVYGYARARRVIWAGFASALFAAAMAAFITAIPPDASWNSDLGGISMQQAFALNFGQVPRIIFASVLAIWAGEMANAFVMAKMKVQSAGKALYQRTIGSTMVGQAVDTLIFYPLAFWGVWSSDLIIKVMLTNYLLKVGWEVLLTPFTYLVVNRLKRSEGVDVYDKDTHFTPFSIKS
ncbi:queuosine precursor transporter [Bowmanella denitrificans]|uniref:queuosine precursor transporter n=1 Tax=Bowmanella denitrificans TaxID=366582 RepID=UPI000C9ACC9B|nr:queuosine precursor transporter [Bowmanella denitrificans]